MRRGCTTRWRERRSRRRSRLWLASARFAEALRTIGAGDPRVVVADDVEELWPRSRRGSRRTPLSSSRVARRAARATRSIHHRVGKIVSALPYLHASRRQLPSLRFHAFERLQLHHLPRGRRGGDGAAAGVHRRPILIRRLRTMKVRQVVREGTPDIARRQGTTPTMGGLIFLIARSCRRCCGRGSSTTMCSSRCS